MIRVGMSTSCVYPLPLREAFRLARLAGFDGVEIMVTTEKSTQDAAAILALSRAYDQPILSIHAPVLPLTQLVWGSDPAAKLRHSAQLALDVGARTVVVHPPFRWQPRFAQAFEIVVGEIAAEYGVDLAVENMFGWRIGERDLRVYSPTPDPTGMAVDAMTLDFSHAAIAGRDGLDLALAMGSRLRHIHLCDGLGGTLLDEHLIPGHGSQPVAEVLAYLAATGWKGSVVAEVHTRTARGDADRLAVLTETLEFARSALDPNRMHYRERHHTRKAARRGLPR
ncbi:MAG TPA: sugar phosphate isomerase/epimerase [Galbitalea sp.]|jgi:sugar phosphate isomerase/epimerase